MATSDFFDELQKKDLKWQILAKLLNGRFSYKKFPISNSQSEM